MDLYSLYLHVPFCRHRCSYCDFNTFAGQDRMIPAYVEAICKEIEQVSANYTTSAEGGPERIPVHTIFFGGGTPSLLNAGQLQAILSTVRERFDVREDAEISLEANPGTVTQQSLRDLRRLGINRLSFGMQSAHPDDLRLLERQHDFFDVVQAVQWARKAGFDNLSLDLIFGLPEQDLPRWQATVQRAVEMAPDHLSLYSLTIEHGTPLYKRWSHGLVPLVDDDLAGDMFEWAMQWLSEASFEQYEISNWARRRADGTLMSCRHNLQYWCNRPYLGFGPGAHGYAAGFRTMNIGGIRPFVDRCQKAKPDSFPCGPATRRSIRIHEKEAMQETMMVGLRLTQEGVSERRFREQFGKSIHDVFASEVEKLTKAGLIEWFGAQEDKHLRLTQRGRMVGNQVFMQFVGE